MKTLIAAVFMLHAIYGLVPPVRGIITEFAQSCPLSLAFAAAPISMGDRNGLNPR